MTTKTTDNKNEIFDIVDENDQVIGQATRGEVHGNPNLIHRSIAVAVFNSRGELFLQKRSALKDTDPLKWTISCSGHVTSNKQVNPSTPLRAGKSTNKQFNKYSISLLLIYKKAAKRELWEELGIRGADLTFITKYLCRAPNETEMSVLFKIFWDKPMKLQHEEIIEGRFFTQKELLNDVKSGQISISFMGKVTLKKLGWIV